MLVGITLSIATTPGQEVYGTVMSSSMTIERSDNETYLPFSISTEITGEWVPDVITNCDIGFSITVTPEVTGELIIWKLYDEWDQETFELAYAAELDNPENDSESWSEYTGRGLSADNAVLYKTMRTFGEEAFLVVEDASYESLLFDFEDYNEAPYFYDIPYIFRTTCGDHTEHFVFTLLDSEEPHTIDVEANVSQTGSVNASPIGCSPIPDGADVEFEVSID